MRQVSGAYGEFVQPRAAQIQAADLPDVQPAAAQIAPMPCLLALTTFTNIVEILNRTRTDQERLFYIVYSFRERLKKLELRRCLVNDTYSSLLAEFANERIRQHGKTTV